MYLDVGTNVVQLCGPSNKTWGWIPFILADKGAYWAPWKTDEGTLTDGKRVAPQQAVSLKLGTIATLWELAYELKDGCIHPVCAGREWPGLLSANREKIVLLLCGLSSVSSRQLPAVEVTLLLSLTSAKWANRVFQVGRSRNDPPHHHPHPLTPVNDPPPRVGTRQGRVLVISCCSFYYYLVPSLPGNTSNKILLPRRDRHKHFPQTPIYP